MHNNVCTAHNIDCMLKQSHGGVDSSLFNSLACVGGALDWITVEYFCLLLTLLSAISPVAVCLFLGRKGSLFDAFEQHEQLLMSSNPTFAHRTFKGR